MLVVRILGLAGAAALLNTASLAADLSLPPPLPPPVLQVPVVAVTSGWYLRGDIGMGIQQFNDFQHNQTNPNFVWPASWQIVQKNIGDTDFIGFGVGYQWNNWLRFDVTGEHRKTSELKVIGAYSGFNDFCPPVRPAAVADLLRPHPGTAFRLGRHGECLCRPRHLVVSYPLRRCWCGRGAS